MKKIFYIIIFLQISCTTKPPIQKVVVTNITALTTTMSVTHTRSSGSGAGGAAGGAIAGYLLGGKLTHVVTGGIVGYGLTHDPKTESWTQIESETTYTFYLSNGDSVKSQVQNYLHKGDSVCKCHYMKYCIYE